MALESGARLGAYEIVSPLGAGGMGEVFRCLIVVEHWLEELKQKLQPNP